jgi:chromosome partitioning protein
MTSIAFFNTKGGVGKTSLVYHLAWMFAELDVQVVVADLDPQANLSAMFLEEQRLEQLWPDGEHGQTVLGAVRPILRGIGDVIPPHVEDVHDNIGLVVGDLGLSAFEAALSREWPRCLDRKESAFRVISAFHRLIRSAAEQRGATLALIDVGPNLGAINRAALLSAEHVVVPLAPDLFSLQGLRNLGPTLRTWRAEWAERLSRNPVDIELPTGAMEPRGYVVLQHAVRLDRPVKAYARWMSRIPGVYATSVLGQDTVEGQSIHDDPHCLDLLKHYRSLMPLAMDARKPMFSLKPADGAIGAHGVAVSSCREDFRRLAREIASRCGVSVS